MYVCMYVYINTIHMYILSCWFAGGQVAPRGRWAGLWINGDFMVIWGFHPVKMEIISHLYSTIAIKDWAFNALSS